MLAQPTWQGIPVEVKKDIVELLDYKSRFRLRVCSKIDKALVDGSPFHISQILFHVTDPFAYCFLLVTNQGIEVRITTNAVEHFVNIFMQKRSVVAEVKIVCSAQSWLINRTKEVDTPLIRLIDMIELLGPNFKTRTRKIDLFIRGMEEYYYLEVLQLFDPKFLESITLSRGISRGTLEKMTEFDVWKSAKELHSQFVQNISVDWILHMEKIVVFFEKITGKDVDKLIKSFITRKDIERGFGFQLRHGNTLSLRKIPCLNELNKDRRRTRRNYVYYTQHFPTTNKELFFFVKISNQTITGSACCASNYIEDFYSCHPRYHGPVLDIRECDQRQRTFFKQGHIVCAERRQRVREQAVFDNYGDYSQYGSYSIRPVNFTEKKDVVNKHSEPAAQAIPFNPDASLYIPSSPSAV
ncbi:hypothetical protein CAEBREN_01643 [Caenorhabditis brenneri]|uniref:F-box domain-containing protein n=1 Tax=Caenorhabditis brenneri TaxID=135651 RepID=G0NEL5_CAEBE|nr:hypothetical protein CAEBREN_01643 [Caenorhabditis brenneri]